MCSGGRRAIAERFAWLDIADLQDGRFNGCSRCERGIVRVEPAGAVETDAGADEISAQHLAPTNDSEAATVQRLAPGAYTLVVSGKAGATGVALVEVYDLSRNSNSNLSNISTRGFVGTGDDVLISGFIVGGRNDETAVIRAVGPSLAAAGVPDALSNPQLQVYDSNGTILATNDDWMSDAGANQIEAVGLAPTDTSEAATILTLTPGSYTAIVSGAAGSSGVGLVEVYNLP